MFVATMHICRNIAIGNRDFAKGIPRITPLFYPRQENFRRENKCKNYFCRCFILFFIVLLEKEYLFILYVDYTAAKQLKSY